MENEVLVFPVKFTFCFLFVSPPVQWCKAIVMLHNLDRSIGGAKNSAKSHKTRRGCTSYITMKYGQAV